MEMIFIDLIKPSPNFKGTGKNMEYNEWEHKKNGTSWKQQIRDEIDKLIPEVNSLDELLQILEERGYEIKRGKYISVKAPGQERFVRTKTLGEEYTDDSLNIRIIYRDVGAGTTPIQDDHSQLRAAYAAVIGDVRILAEERRKVPRKQNMILPYSADNDLDVYRLSAQLSVINQERIGSIGELTGRINRLKYEFEKHRTEVNQLIDEYSELTSLLEHIRTYHELSEKSDISASEELKLTIAKQTMQRNNILSTADELRLRERAENLGKRITAIKQRLDSCKQQYDVYSDIAKTYHEISEGDYIGRLVEEERRRKERGGSETQKDAVKYGNGAAETVPIHSICIIQKIRDKRSVFIAYRQLHVSVKLPAVGKDFLIRNGIEALFLTVRKYMPTPYLCHDGRSS